MHEWLKSYTPGCYIDVKDNTKTWKVSKISSFSESVLTVEINSTQDEEFSPTSPNLAPFRKYTSLSSLKPYTLSVIDLSTLSNNLQNLPETGHEITQLLRGKLFFAVEYLLDWKFPAELENSAVLEFFQRFLDYFAKYLGVYQTLLPKGLKAEAQETEDFETGLVKSWPEVCLTAKRIFGLDPKTNRTLITMRLVPENYKYCPLTADKKSTLSFIVNYFASIGGFEQILNLVSAIE